MHAGELFIAGRFKDLIIVRGRNHHPADLEATVGQAHAALHPGGGAAFAIERDREDQVIVVQECVERTIDRPDDIHAAIRAAVSRDHDLELDAIVLVARGGVPKTTSGKTRRGTCREQFLAGTLPVSRPGRAPETTPERTSRRRPRVMPRPRIEPRPYVMWSQVSWGSRCTT